MTQWSPQPVVEWLFSSGCMLKDNTRFVHELAHRLNDCGAPVDRLRVTIRTLNPQIVGASYSWLRSTDVTTHQETAHAVSQTDRYIGSPLKQLFDTGKRVRQRLDQLPEDAHRAYTDLAEDGFIDYLALPVMTADGLGSTIILNTKQTAGFNDHDIENFRTIRNYLAPILEVQALRRLSKSVLDSRCQGIADAIVVTTIASPR